MEGEKEIQKEYMGSRDRSGMESKRVKRMGIREQGQSDIGAWERCFI